MFQRILSCCIAVFGFISMIAGNGLAQSVFRVGAWCLQHPSPAPQAIYQQNPPTGPWRIFPQERDKLLNLGLNYFIACTGLNAEDALAFMGDSLFSAPAPKDFKSTLTYVENVPNYFPDPVVGNLVWALSRYAEQYPSNPSWADKVQTGYNHMYTRNQNRLNGVHSFLTAAEGCINQSNKISGINFMCDNSVIDSYVELAYIPAPYDCHTETSYYMASHLTSADHLAITHYVYRNSTPSSGIPFQTAISGLVEAYGTTQRGIRDSGSAAKFWVNLQTQESPDIPPGDTFRSPTQTELLCSVNLALAYGTKGIVYYLYAPVTAAIDPNAEEYGLLDANRNPRQPYYDAQVINTNYQGTGQNLVTIGNNFLNLTWKEGYPIHQNTNEPINSTYKLYDVTAKIPGGATDTETETYVEAGVLQNGSTNHYMVVNRRCTSSETREITIKFQTTTNNAYRVTDVFTNTPTTYYPANTTELAHTITLGPGQGKLLKLEDLGNWTGAITSNTTWSGTVYMNSHITVNSGVTLTIASGTTLKAASSKKLTVTGSLQAIGTVSQPITFDRSGGSNWNGLWIENSTANSNLDYCTVRNAANGIRLRYTSGTVMVDHATLTNNQIGLVSEFSSPFTIQNSAIQNNTAYGIWITSSAASGIMKILYTFISSNGANHGVHLYNGADAYLGFNNISNNSQHGVSCHTNSDPYMRSASPSPDYGNNIITYNGGAGVKAVSNSYPALGINFQQGALKDYYGYNEIHSNTGYQIENANASGTIMAERNYWSANPSVPATPEDLYGSVDYDPVLPEDPTIVADGEKFSLQKSLIDFEEAFALENQGDFQGAADLYLKLLKSDPEADNVGFGVSGLIRCYKGMERRKEISELMDQLIDAFPETVLAASAKDHSLPYLVQRGDHDLALLRSQELLSQNRENVETEPNLLFQIAGIYYLKSAGQAGDDLSHAQDTYQELIQKYADSDFAFFAGLELEELGGSGLGRPATDSPPNTLTQKSFELKANYPNPFNPETMIRFRLIDPQKIRLLIFDLTGKLVRTLAEGEFPAGEQAISWDGHDQQGQGVASGVYFYELIMDNKVERRKMALIR